MNYINKKIAVGFSGGVDSTVIALLLKKHGYHVHAFTFIFTDDYLKPDFQTYMAELVELLGVEHSFIDLRDRFRRTVLDYFTCGYLKGITPNPCVYCNNELKWPELFRVAHDNGIQQIAMGHYARIVKFEGKCAVAKSNDADKDQSFFLWKLSPKQLENIEFPLGNYDKSEVKLLAAHEGLAFVAARKESTGACFVKKDYRKTLQQIVSSNQLPGYGNFIDMSGNVVGRHNGFPFYTIGQRHGLGLKSSKRLFVKEIKSGTNQIVLSEANGLWCSEFFLIDCVIHFPRIAFSEIVEVKIRYRNQLTFARLYLQNDIIQVKTVQPVWAVTPGQTAAIYYGDILIGGGFIQ